MTSTPYALGYEAGMADFWNFTTTPNPYPLDCEAHDVFEQGWDDGYYDTLDDLQ